MDLYQDNSEFDTSSVNFNSKDEIFCVGSQFSKAARPPRPISIKDEHGWELEFPLKPNHMYARKRSASPEKMTGDIMEGLGAPEVGVWALND